MRGAGAVVAEEDSMVTLQQLIRHRRSARVFETAYLLAIAVIATTLAQLAM
jgi:hypothetical protein